MRYYYYFMYGLLQLIYSFSPTHCNNRCIPITSFKRFYKIRSCHKSSLPIIALENFETVYECMKFARERKGLAFNYSPPEARNLTKGYLRNCQVMACPEVGNSSTLMPDIIFDYYSTYGNINATENAACLKSLGLFEVIKEKQNYTEAIKTCHNLGADLANILSEIRTNNLALLLKNSIISDWYKAAYIGLDDIAVKGTFVTPLNDLLSCTKFRAWSPGYPRKNHKHENCVILDSERTWRAIKCKTKLAFICEFYSEAPQIEDKFVVNCKNITTKKEKKVCDRRKQFLELYNNSSRMDQCALLDTDEDSSWILR